MDVGTVGWIWGHQGGYRDTEMDVGHCDGCGDGGVHVGTLDIGTLQDRCGDTGMDVGCETSGWTWGLWDGCGDKRRDMGTLGQMKGQWDGCGDSKMDMGPLGWIQGH